MTMDGAWRLVNTEENGRLICYMAERWSDEYMYEDIQDYLGVLQTKIPGVYRMTKRPFGFYMKCDDGELHVRVKIHKETIELCGDRYRKAG